MTAPVLPPSSDPTSQILVELGKINVTLAIISKTLDAIPDHEQRIRKLEAWRYGLPMTGLVAVASLALGVYEVMHH